MSKPKVKKKVSHHELKKSLTDLKEALSGSMGDKANEVKDKATDLINDLLENIQEKSHDYQENLEEYIAEKPLKSVAIALGIGILVAKILL